MTNHAHEPLDAATLARIEEIATETVEGYFSRTFIANAWKKVSQKTLTSLLREATRRAVRVERARWQEEVERLREEALKWRRIRTPTHGVCCTCQACGQYYDDCRCDLDQVAARAEAAERENERLRRIEATARILSNQLALVAAAEAGVYTFASVHGMSYTGPTYYEQKAALDAALDERSEKP